MKSEHWEWLLISYLIRQNAMATEYLLQASVENHVTDITASAGLNDDSGEEPDKNLKPLHYAAWNNKIEAVKSLLKYGAGNLPVSPLEWK